MLCIFWSGNNDSGLYFVKIISRYFHMKGGGGKKFESLWERRLEGEINTDQLLSYTYTTEDMYMKWSYSTAHERGNVWKLVITMEKFVRMSSQQNFFLNKMLGDEYKNGLHDYINCVCDRNGKFYMREVLHLVLRMGGGDTHKVEFHQFDSESIVEVSQVR